MISGHDMWSVAFSPDGQWIVSGGVDNTLTLWDADSGRPRGCPLTGHTEKVYSVAFSPDGHRIVSGSADGTVRLWPAPDRSAWAELLCSKLVNNMSHQQWRAWVSPDVQYVRTCPGLPIPDQF